MSDIDLLAMGCVVSFIVAAGAYVAIRERYEARTRKKARAEAARLERAA